MVLQLEPKVVTHRPLIVEDWCEGPCPRPVSSTLRRSGSVQHRLASVFCQRTTTNDQRL